MAIPTLSSVLLVDDDSTANYLTNLLLTKTMQVANQVLIVENGQEALAILARACADDSPAGCPQLILLDMNMPVMNGLEFLAAYSQLPPPQRQAIVVILTTSLYEQDELLARQLPITDFLTKPLTQAKMTDLLARHFPNLSA